MDNATNNEHNLDKDPIEWQFRIRFTRSEMEFLSAVTETPHPAYLDNLSMMVYAEELERSVEWHLEQEGNHFFLDFTYTYLDSLNGLVQNLEESLYSRDGFDHHAEMIFYGTRDILEPAKRALIRSIETSPLDPFA